MNRLVKLILFLLSFNFIFAINFDFFKNIFSDEYYIHVNIDSTGDVTAKKNLNNVTYSIENAKTNQDIISDVLLEPNKNNRYKIIFENIDIDMNLVIKYFDEYGRYVRKIPLKKVWFSDTYVKTKERTIKKERKSFPKGIRVGNSGEYPYEFFVTLVKKKPHVRGYVYETKDGYEVPIKDANIRFNYPSIIGSKTTNYKGEFQWDVDLGYKKSVTSNPEIIAVKLDYLLSTITFDKDIINNSDTTGLLRIKLQPKKQFEFGELDCGNFSDILEYNSDCDQCVCKNKNLIFYPRYGVCEKRCAKNKVDNWTNSEGTSTLIFRDMSLECIDAIGDISRRPDAPLSDVKLVSVKITQPLDSEISLLYPDNFNPNQSAPNKLSRADSLIGIINDNGQLRVHNSYISFNHAEHDVEQTIKSRELSIDKNNFFFLKKNKSSYRFIIKYRGEEYKVKLRNKKYGDKHRFSNLEFFTIMIEYNPKKDEFEIKSLINNGKFNNIKETDPTMYMPQTPMSSDPNEDDLIKNIKEEDRRIEEQKKYDGINFKNKACSIKFNDLYTYVDECDWPNAKNISDKIIIEECAFDFDLALMSIIMKPYFHETLEYDDTKFLDELNLNVYNSSNPSVFEKLDALYRRYDEVKILSRDNIVDYSSTEVAQHYYRKFRFYLSYAEFLLGGLQKTLFTGEGYCADGTGKCYYQFPYIYMYRSTKDPWYVTSGSVNKEETISTIIDMLTDSYKEYIKKENECVKTEDCTRLPIKQLKNRAENIIKLKKY